MSEVVLGVLNPPKLPCSPPGLLLARRVSEPGLADVRGVSYLSVVQDLRDVAGDRSICRSVIGVHSANQRRARWITRVNH